MTRDFTLDKYSELMLALMGGYKVMCVADYLSAPVAGRPVAVLYHTVEKMPERAARMALLEKRLGLRTTYYFLWDPKAIYWAGTGQDRYGNFPELQVTEARLYGHEVGYFPAEGEDADSRVARLRALAPVATSLSAVQAQDMLGGPFSPEFSDFLRVSESGRGWLSGSGQRLRGTGAVAELLGSVEHTRVLLGTRPDRWRG